MRDIDTFNRTSILENAKVCIKRPIKLILAQLPFILAVNAQWSS